MIFLSPQWTFSSTHSFTLPPSCGDHLTDRGYFHSGSAIGLGKIVPPLVGQLFISIMGRIVDMGKRLWAPTDHFLVISVQYVNDLNRGVMGEAGEAWLNCQSCPRLDTECSLLGSGNVRKVENQRYKAHGWRSLTQGLSYDQECVWIPGKEWLPYEGMVCGHFKGLIDGWQGEERKYFNAEKLMHIAPTPVGNDQSPRFGNSWIMAWWDYD